MFSRNVEDKEMSEDDFKIILLSLFWSFLGGVIGSLLAMFFWNGEE